MWASQSGVHPAIRVQTVAPCSRRLQRCTQSMGYVGGNRHWQQFDAPPILLIISVLPSGSTGPAMHQGYITGLAKRHM